MARFEYFIFFDVLIGSGCSESIWPRSKKKKIHHIFVCAHTISPKLPLPSSLNVWMAQTRADIFPTFFYLAAAPPSNRANANHATSHFSLRHPGNVLYLSGTGTNFNNVATQTFGPPYPEGTVAQAQCLNGQLPVSGLSSVSCVAGQWQPSSQLGQCIAGQGRSANKFLGKK